MFRIILIAGMLLAAGQAYAGCWGKPDGTLYCDDQPIRTCFPVGDRIYCG